MEGIVVRKIAGFYGVLVDEEEITCRARGRIKKEKVKILVGDHVRVEEEENGSVIAEVLQRRNLLPRPPIANVDQLIIVFAADRPAFNPRLLDRFLILAEAYSIPPLICINKIDLVDDARLEEIVAPYESIGYPVVKTAAKQGNVEELRPYLLETLSVFAGPSGVGKSKILSQLRPGLELVSAEVSEKIGRGRHTTRHAVLYPVLGGLVADTPGFSFLEFDGIAPEMLAWYYPEMRPFIPQCKLSKCLHRTEPQCAVKEQANVNPERYEHYLAFLDELMEQYARSLNTSSKVEEAVKQTGERRIIRLGAEARQGSRQQIKTRLRELADSADIDDDSDWV